MLGSQCLRKNHMYLIFNKFKTNKFNKNNYKFHIIA